MARVKSSEKRTAILQAAVQEIAEAGLVASTAKIARRADVATGTLFTYFASKEELLNELYLALKMEVYTRVNADFPHQGSLERRTRHIWKSYLDWAIEFPERRKVSVQLNVSDVITAETRIKTAPQREIIESTLVELGSRGALTGLPAGVAASVMTAMQEATMELIAKHPRQREELMDRAFHIFWRSVQ
jgi:AcrR family transcriptional regulator